MLGPSHINWSTLLPITIIYTIFLLVGVCGNLITCIVILNNEYMWTATNVYLLNLVVADIATLVISKCCRVLTNHFLLGPHSLLQSSQLKKLPGIFIIFYIIPVMPSELYLMWQQYPWTFGDFACDAKIVVTEAIIYASIFTVVAFSCER